MARKKNRKNEVEVTGGVVDSMKDAERLAREEAEAANVTPAAVMYSAPDGAVAGDGNVTDASPGVEVEKAGDVDADED